MLKPTTAQQQASYWLTCAILSNKTTIISALIFANAMRM
jgi:hypothetical protein